jgi:hypothetical protein
MYDNIKQAAPPSSLLFVWDKQPGLSGGRNLMENPPAAGRIYDKMVRNV